MVGVNARPAGHTRVRRRNPRREQPRPKLPMAPVRFPCDTFQGEEDAFDAAPWPHTGSFNRALSWSQSNPGRLGKYPGGGGGAAISIRTTMAAEPAARRRQPPTANPQPQSANSVRPTTNRQPPTAVPPTANCQPRGRSLFVLTCAHEGRYFQREFRASAASHRSQLAGRPRAGPASHPRDQGRRRHVSDRSVRGRRLVRRDPRPKEL